MSTLNDPFSIFLPKEKVENVITTKAESMWSYATQSLTEFFTGSIQNSNTGKYYNDVYIRDDQTTDVQFSVSYGHRLGYGSEGGVSSGETNPTKAIYSQFRQVLLPAQTTQFNFHGDSGTDYNSDDIFIININRARYREKMDPGNWELHIKSGSYTIHLIDDSGAASNASIAASKREFWVVSGSVANGVHTTAASTATTTTSGSYGSFYPETGMVILNPSILSSGHSDRAVHTVGTSTTVNEYNHKKLFESIKAGSYFTSRREEQIKTSYYFCKVHHNQYNWSQNPSYFTSSNGEIVNPGFFTDPHSYITTVGLYNQENELLAVAKLSKPLLKNFNKEAMLTVKLEY